ncbi:MAG: PAS/PAC sensor hybrid histidine kinase [Candidatus Uhrbacteria bacterium GW2011_GWA2_53_10]|uniref:PAS/PAC sensor hybrid histidine kinase n=1 Tax=Candidatus Uhrbacteria bacterium GW2011_GWA2_53_10 TaxID=1618980 RepID=A0A0G1ZWI3_9BACT|nr:MAG: PAS/PAC sensor hybrid histidine kinase [Candidatus Uhrbacteria bacterium GW2011_GWA2_53_10]
MPDPKPKLLLVDDEPLVRSALRRALKHEFDIIEAENGFEGAQHFLTDPEIRRVLSDARMPNGSGVELHRMIADQLKERDGRFVIYTGDMPAAWVDYFLSQSVKIVDKPVDNDVIRDLFKDVKPSSRPE